MRASDWTTEDRHLLAYQRANFQRSSSIWDGSPGIHTLLGPRRIGKTTQFKLWMRDLSQKVGPTQIGFLDAERFESWKELLPALERTKSPYLFVDEVTAVIDWPRAFKILADEGKLEGVCIWITGSNAFDLKNASEKLPGRRGRDLLFRDLELLPLTFREFYSATKSKHLGGDQENLDAGFADFCKWGGYPMAVSEYLSRESPSADLLQELLDVSLGEASRKHRSPRLTAALAERLWLNLAARSSYHAISKQIDIGSHPLVRQYVEILEGCYSILSTERFNAKTKSGVLRKEKKIYFMDPLIMAALVTWAEKGEVDPSWIAAQWADPVQQGKWVENVVACELRKRS